MRMEGMRPRWSRGDFLLASPCVLGTNHPRLPHGVLNLHPAQAVAWHGLCRSALIETPPGVEGGWRVIASQSRCGQGGRQKFEADNPSVAGRHPECRICRVEYTRRAGKRSPTTKAMPATAQSPGYADSETGIPLSSLGAGRGISKRDLFPTPARRRASGTRWRWIRAFLRALLHRCCIELAEPLSNREGRGFRTECLKALKTCAGAALRTKCGPSAS